MVTIYAIKLQKNKYYIGKSNNHTTRILNHFKSNGSMWTKQYKPICIDNVFYNCSDFDEDKYVKMYMAEYGINNVRGGTYSTFNLDKQVQQFIMKEIIASTDRCFKCHKVGHFSSTCDNARDNARDNDIYLPELNSFDISKYKIKCFRCNGVGHNYTSCYLIKNIYGTQIDSNICFRCGKRGHWAIECNSEFDIDNNFLANRFL